MGQNSRSSILDTTAARFRADRSAKRQNYDANQSRVPLHVRYLRYFLFLHCSVPATKFTVSTKKPLTFKLRSCSQNPKNAGSPLAALHHFAASLWSFLHGRSAALQSGAQDGRPDSHAWPKHSYSISSVFVRSSIATATFIYTSLVVYE